MTSARREVYGGDGFAAWRRGHGRAAIDAMQRLRSTPIATALTLAVLCLALLLPLLFGMALVNAQRFASSLEATRDISVFLEADRGAAVAGALAAQWSGRGDVDAVIVRTPAQGLEEFRQMSDLAGVLGLLDTNPLPYVLVVTPRADPEALARLLADAPGVDSVQYDAAWRERLDAWLSLADRVALLLTALLGSAALLIIGNTVRLDLASRRDEIALLQHLGADDAAIRRPLLYAGIFYGAASGGLALAIAGVVGWVLRAPLAALDETYAGGFALSGIDLTGGLAFVAAAAGLGWFGARVSAGHHLRTTRPVEQ